MCAIGLLSLVTLSAEEGEEWGSSLVHQKSNRKYRKKLTSYLFRQLVREIVYDHAVWDHVKGEIICRIDRDGIIDILRKKYGIEISPEDS